MTRCVGVGGSWSWKGGWWQPDSPLWTYLRQHGLLQAFPAVKDRYGNILRPATPFEWDTGIGSSLKFWRSAEARCRIWKVAGDALAYYLDGIDYEDRNVITHSHGLQPALFCAAKGVEIRRLLSIAGPYREDMQATAAKAIANIGYWLHVYDPDKDRIGWLGGMFDGDVGNQRTQPLAINLPIKKISHSRLVSDPAAFPHWQEAGLIAFLQSPEEELRRA